MIHYNKNTAIVLDALAKCQYDKRSIFLTKRCYAEFADYMVNKPDTIFSPQEALSWCEIRAVKTYKNQFKSAICRLADVYKHNHVLGSHLRFHRPLPERYSEAIDTYKVSLSKTEVYSDNSLRRIKEVCTQFCLFLQANGMYSISEIDYPILEQYHEYIQKSFATYQEFEGMVSGFLKYWADNGCCRIGLALFMHYVGMGKCTSLESLSFNARIIIERQREASNIFPSDDFYSSISEFTSRLEKAGYSKRITNSAAYHLTILYLFLDQESLGYDKKIANSWLNDVGHRLFGDDMFRKARRTIEMYEDYVNEGDVLASHRWKHRLTSYDNLPMWCKLELDHFAEVKKKEGWAIGTIISIRTCVTRFCLFLVSEGVDAFTTLTPEIIKLFNIQDKHQTPSGKNLCNRRVRQFLIHLEIRHIVQEGLHFALPRCATGGQKIVEVLSQEDRTLIETYCERACSPLELRDAAILKIGMTTALRASDIISLKISNIDWKNKLIRVVQNKTKAEHVHLMEVETGNAIFRYLRDGRYKGTDSDYIFIASHAPFGPVRTKVCSDAMRRAGTSTTDFHRLRRTCATDMLSAGATFIETAELLGHSDTHNIHKYTALDKKRMSLCPLSLAETDLMIEGRYSYE